MTKGCVTRFISRANSALELRSFSKFLPGMDDAAGLGAIMRDIPNLLLASLCVSLPLFTASTASFLLLSSFFPYKYAPYSACSFSLFAL